MIKLVIRLFNIKRNYNFYNYIINTFQINLKIFFFYFLLNKINFYLKPKNILLYNSYIIWSYYRGINVYYVIWIEWFNV